LPFLGNPRDLPDDETHDHDHHDDGDGLAPGRQRNEIEQLLGHANADEEGPGNKTRPAPITLDANAEVSLEGRWVIRIKRQAALRATQLGEVQQ